MLSVLGGGITDQRGRVGDRWPVDIVWGDKEGGGWGRGGAGCDF